MECSRSLIYIAYAILSDLASSIPVVPATRECRDKVAHDVAILWIATLRTPE